MIAGYPFFFNFSASRSAFFLSAKAPTCDQYIFLIIITSFCIVIKKMFLGGIYMESLQDYVKWIAQQNVIHLDDNQIKKFTNWLIRNEKYNEVVEELIEMMRQVERK